MCGIPAGGGGLRHYKAVIERVANLDKDKGCIEQSKEIISAFNYSEDSNFQVVLDVLLAATSEKENILITGQSGTGKITLIKALLGLYPQKAVAVNDFIDLSVIRDLYLTKRVVHFDNYDELNPGVDAVSCYGEIFLPERVKGFCVDGIMFDSVIASWYNMTCEQIIEKMTLDLTEVGVFEEGNPDLEVVFNALKYVVHLDFFEDHRIISSIDKVELDTIRGEFIIPAITKLVEFDKKVCQYVLL